ncbi:MAG: hypothetical protein ACTSYS_13790 [Promethearchaeota archaeon]
MSEMITLYFTTRVGPEKKTTPFPASSSLLFLDVIKEVCNKFGLEMQTLSIATPAGMVLSTTDFSKSVKLVINEYGNAFEIIDQGIVGI